MQLNADSASEVANEASKKPDRHDKRLCFCFCLKHSMSVSSKSPAILSCPFDVILLSLSTFLSFYASSLLEKKMEAFQGYLAQHKDQIRLVLHLVLAAGKVF